MNAKFQWFNNRESIVKSENRFDIDESQLDIFSLCNEVYPEFKVTKELQPFDKVTKLYLDIETLGLDPEIDRVTLIGFINEKGSWKIISDEDEKIMLARALKIIADKKPEILAGFNNIDFDIKFLIRRCEINGIIHPFYQGKKLKTFSTAQKFNKATQYYPYYLSWADKSKTNIIDLYHQVLAWDFVARKLVKHGLKDSVIQLGLRKERRLELSYKEMLECWATRNQGGLKKLKEYLVYDLLDTKLLGDFLIPSIYYQKMFLPDWGLQSLADCGNGSKHNDIAKKCYPDQIFYTNFHNVASGVLDAYFLTLDSDKAVRPDEAVKFTGGYTEGIAGIFRNCFKIDFTSLYPFIMLLYGICSRKDTNRITLGILKYMRDRRVVLKKEGKTDINKKQQEGSLKVLINSAYGMLGTRGIDFNDYEAAALVTAYGRALIKFVKQVVHDNGGKCIELDTDGAIVSCQPGEEKKIWQACQDALPKGFNLEFEWLAKMIYIPPADVNTGEGLKKNYIILDLNDGKNLIPVKANGRFRKRDVPLIKKRFQPELLRIYLQEGKRAATAYFDELIYQLLERTIDMSEIVIVRKAKSNEKRVFELNLVDEDGIAEYYMGTEKVWRGRGKNKIQVDEPAKVNLGDYNVKYYVELVSEMYNEMYQYMT